MVTSGGRLERVKDNRERKHRCWDWHCSALRHSFAAARFTLHQPVTCTHWTLPLIAYHRTPRPHTRPRNHPQRVTTATIGRPCAGWALCTAADIYAGRKPDNDCNRICRQRLYGWSKAWSLSPSSNMVQGLVKHSPNKQLTPCAWNGTTHPRSYLSTTPRVFASNIHTELSSDEALKPTVINHPSSSPCPCVKTGLRGIKSASVRKMSGAENVATTLPFVRSTLINRSNHLELRSFGEMAKKCRYRLLSIFTSCMQTHR